MKTNLLNKLAATFLLTIGSISSTIAQLDIDIDLGKAKWYEDPKIWVGVAAFLLILAFIARGKRS